MLMSPMTNKLYYLLYSLVLSLFIIPWMYFDDKMVDYSFLPKKVIFMLMAFVSVLIIFNRKLSIRKAIKLLLFASLAGMHWYLNGYNEPHYLYQFLYLEIAVLVILAPDKVKERMLKYSTFVFYALLLKALYFKIGSYVHGGFLSSNLFASYIVYLGFVEVYKKHYFSLLPAIFVLYFVGSKAGYMAISILSVFALVAYFSQIKQLDQVFLRIKDFTLVKRVNFYWPLAIAAVAVLVFTKIMVRSESHRSWTQEIEPSREESTQNNMITYGLDKSDEGEKKREIFLVTKEQQFKEKEISVFKKPLITDINVSIGTRLIQYDYMYSNLHKYFLVGNTIKSQSQMLGHNPHSAFVDIISRLGVLYLLLVLFFYSHLFKSMNLFYCNVSIIPILAFQPYGFSIGHSIIVLSLVYALAKTAKERNKSTYLL